jgi:hypothetical protein
MIDPFSAVAIGFLVGAGAGALSAFLGWNKTTEIFDTRKFVSGLVTGIVAGLALALANTEALKTAADETALLVSYITLTLAVLGTDTVRTSVTGAIANRPKTS